VLRFKRQSCIPCVLNVERRISPQDRAHRIGQKHEVRVFRLVTDSPVEERIISRATDKLNMTGLVVEAGKFNRDSKAAERKWVMLTVPLFLTVPLSLLLFFLLLLLWLLLSLVVVVVVYCWCCYVSLLLIFFKSFWELLNFSSSLRWWK